jgi:hypothetical protein
MMHGKKSKMKTSGGMPMVKKDGKMVPSFAADGVGKMKAGGAAGMMKPKMAAGGGMMRSKMGMSGGIGEEVTVRGSGAARSSKARIY